MPVPLRLMLLLLLVGCYRYSPVELAVPAPGARVAARLTEAGSDSLARYIGPRVVELEGELLEPAGPDDGLAIAVQVVRYRDGQEDFWKGEPVHVPRGAIAYLRERRVSPVRSILLGGLFSAAALAIGEAGSGAGGGRRPGPPPPPK